jgi:hypothetical protein
MQACEDETAPRLQAATQHHIAGNNVGAKDGKHNDVEDPTTRDLWLARHRKVAHDIRVKLECVVAVIRGVLVHLVQPCEAIHGGVAEELHVCNTWVLRASCWVKVALVWIRASGRLSRILQLNTLCGIIVVQDDECRASYSDNLQRVKGLAMHKRCKRRGAVFKTWRQGPLAPGNQAQPHKHGNQSKPLYSRCSTHVVPTWHGSEQHTGAPVLSSTHSGALVLQVGGPPQDWITRPYSYWFSQSFGKQPLAAKPQI